MKSNKVLIIGAGLAGCEASLYLAKHKVKVKLCEMKKIKKNPAQKSDFLAELVCSNSLKSDDILSASGLLKKEIELLGSSILPIARKCTVSSGGALSVNREEFSKQITQEVLNNKNIEYVDQIVESFDINTPTIVACGPLIDEKLFAYINNLIGKDNCYFYDAIAPIVSLDSIDMTKAYWGNRYNKGETADYLNCLLNKSEYLEFYNQLINAKTIELHSFEKLNVFEGCMPVEVLAKRGEDALRYGPMKPVGLKDERYDEKPYAAVQLRKENEQGTALNMVGFQTNLIFGEQKRVFGLIPALKNAEFYRYGTMHRNSYINAPRVLSQYSSLKAYPNIFIAGQLSGVEGYVESISSGLYCAINCMLMLNGKKQICLPNTTVIGAMQNYLVSAPANNFQPINANYGIIKADNLRNKQEKKQKIYENSLKEINKVLEYLKEN